MTFVCVLVGWIFTLCLHEFCHAYVAYHGGDTSVKDKGYLTLNPLAFTNPVTSIVIPLIIIAIGGIPLPGGAVFIDHERLKSRGWECAVSAAGPGANLIVAVLLSIPFALNLHSPTTFWAGYAFFVYLQVLAAVLNLLPIPPLDGFGVIEPWLDWRLRLKLRPLRSYGFFIILFLLFFFRPSRVLFAQVTTWLAVFVFRIPGELIGQGYENFDIFSVI